MKSPRNIVITGASSGLGKALALAYAKPGVTLYLHGRDGTKLRDTAIASEKRGATIQIYSGDVADGAAMELWLTAIDKAAPIDLIIANAGISAGTGDGGETLEQIKRIFATNIDGVMHTVQPLLPGMIARKRGQIAIISSLAGIRGLPSSPAYSASKAAVRLYGEGLRGWLSASNVEVSVICPGWIKTNMTAVNDFPMPFILEADKAATIIVKGLARNQARIAFPRIVYWPLWLISCLPISWTDWFFARLPGKASH